jgi:hypothetical protein
MLLAVALLRLRAFLVTVNGIITNLTPLDLSHLFKTCYYDNLLLKSSYPKLRTTFSSRVCGS